MKTIVRVGPLVTVRKGDKRDLYIPFKGIENHPVVNIWNDTPTPEIKELDIVSQLEDPYYSGLYYAEPTGKYLEETDPYGNTSMFCEMTMTIKVKERFYIENREIECCKGFLPLLRRVIGRPKVTISQVSDDCWVDRDVTVMVPESSIGFVDIRDPKSEAFVCSGGNTNGSSS
jgi:hypothetical protein